MRYDAAIIGAGAEGLAAATLLARAGLRVRVIERREQVGGRCATREFHPGFRASPFTDDVAAMQAELFWALDLARHGAVFAPHRASLAVHDGRMHVLPLIGDDPSPAATLLRQSAARRAAILARLTRESARRAPWPAFLARRQRPEAWPASDWAIAALADVVGTAAPHAAAHLSALALSGRIADPFLPGSALHLLTAGAWAGRLHGGLGQLSAALLAAARAAGVEFSLGIEATDILRRNERAVGVGLADGSEIDSRSVISTLDLKRTFLAFFPWKALPKPVMRDVHAFRMAGKSARVLFALDNVPALPPPAMDGAAIHVEPSLAALSATYYAWRAGLIADELPVALRLVSGGDVSLAPPDGAVVTATLSGVPFRLFDGAWTHEKREILRRRALEAAEFVSPGFGARVIGCEVVTPSDMDDVLRATDGDLDGGEIAGDQMLDGGPWLAPRLPRTPVEDLYLAGSFLTAGTIATGAAGTAAARALLADRARVSAR